MRFKPLIFSMAVVFAFAGPAIFACGCETTRESVSENGITIGEGRIEDAPAGNETGESRNVDERIIVDESLIPRELTPEEIRLKKKIQAEVEKEYKKISKVAEEWAAAERAWRKAKIAEADLKMAEGNLTEAEKILKAILKKTPDHEEAGKRLLEIAARRRAASEVEKDPEERIIELVKNGENLRANGSYRAAYTLFLEAKRILDTVEDSAIAVRMKPEIEQNLKELAELLPPEEEEGEKK